MNEHDYVMRDADMAEFVDAYFKARPQLLRTRHEECLVEAGFKAAWKPAATAPSVPDILNALRDVLFESARPDVPAERLECPEEWSEEHKQTFSRWVHEEMQNNARRSIIKRARALLQSANHSENHFVDARKMADAVNRRCEACAILPCSCK